MSSAESDYRVVYPEVVRTALSAHIDELLQMGWSKTSVAELAEALNDRLKRSPGDFGEPLYSLPHLKLNVAVGFVGRFAVQFGIREEDRIVFVRKIVPMPRGSRL